jgi:hypothetical protein
MLTQILVAVVAALGGGGGVKGWEKWRRNSRGSIDAQRIVTAIEKSGEKVSNEVRALATETREMHTDVKILLDRGTRRPDEG